MCGNIVIALLLALSGPNPPATSAAMLKQQARNEFEMMRYRRAADLAREATEADSNDAEAWYLRGWHLHFLTVATCPLSGQTRATSDSVLNFI